MGEQAQSNQEGSGHEGMEDGKNSERRTHDTALNRPRQSLLQRVEHLDIIMSALEDKSLAEASSSPSASPQSRHHSSLPTTPSGLERRRKPTVSVLEEVQAKGTLVERVSELERRLMMLQQQIVCLKPTDNVVPGSLHSMLPHRRVVSNLDGYSHPFSQDPIDVEKHEVTLSQSAHFPKHVAHPESSLDSESIETHLAKPQSPHLESYKVAASDEKASADMEHDSGVSQLKSKKRRLRIRKWLLKKLNLHFSGSSKDKINCSTVHCWRPRIHPKNCCNIKKKDMNSSFYTEYGHMPMEEDLYEFRERL